MRFFAGLIGVFMALACGLAHAQAYRWVDKDGKVRYGDTPPPGVKAAPMKGISGSPAPPPPPAQGSKDGKGEGSPAAKAPADPAKEFAERQKKAKEDAAKADKERADAETLKKNCDRAQGSLRALESGQRMSTIDAKGERAILDDAARQVQIAETRGEIAKNCK